MVYTDANNRYFLTVHSITAYQVTQSLLDNGLRAKGKVIALIEKSDSDGSTYAPVFEYKDYRNVLTTFESSTSSNPPSYSVGDSITIVYLKDRSDQRVVYYWGLYGTTILCLAIASPLWIISVGYFKYTYF
ncbi:MAG: DUF3592 domain-containing protein [Saprospiraceae bacterium]|nr:DUF3592 domain-containing protein [Saprospiraceae bacterium]